MNHISSREKKKVGRETVTYKHDSGTNVGANVINNIRANIWSIRNMKKNLVESEIKTEMEKGIKGGERREHHTYFVVRKWATKAI